MCSDFLEPSQVEDPFALRVELERKRRLGAIDISERNLLLTSNLCWLNRVVCCKGFQMLKLSFPLLPPLLKLFQCLPLLLRNTGIHGRAQSHERSLEPLWADAALRCAG